MISIQNPDKLRFQTLAVELNQNVPLLELLDGTHINYWHCVEIIEILKDTEKDSKNFFGQYGSQRMALWKEIVALYQKENIYLGEAAQLLTQAVTYDLPGGFTNALKLLM